MNYYQLLGLPRHASRDQIRAAYLRLAGELHPDRHVGDGEKERAEREKFKQIQEAYEVLRDPDKRRAYDLKHGAIPQRRTHPGPFPRSAAPHGAAPTPRAMRRDIPDDWVKGSGRSLRFWPWLRAMATIGFILLLVTVVVPRLGGILEAQWSELFGDAEDAQPRALERERLAVVQDDVVNRDTEPIDPGWSEPPVEEGTLPEDETDPPIEDLADYLMRENAILSQQVPEVEFDSHVVASQGGPDLFGGVPSSTADLPTYPSNTMVEDQPGYRPRMPGRNSMGQLPATTRYAPSPRAELPGTDSLSSGVPRYDVHFPSAPSIPETRRPELPGGLPDAYRTSNTRGELPGISGYSEKLLGSDPARSFDSNAPSPVSTSTYGKPYGTGGLPNYSLPRTPSIGNSRSRTSALYPQ